MNFEELRNKYQQEDQGEVRIPSDIAHLRKALHPLEKLQKSMKKEFWMQVIALVIFAAFPYILGILPQLYPVYYTAYAMVVVISAYYLYGFYKFYKEVGLYNGSTLSSLWRIYYELRLNVERYRSFGFLLLPFMVITLGLHFYSSFIADGKHLEDIGRAGQYAIVIATGAGTVTVVAGIVLWSKYVYGPYVKILERLLDELKTEE